MGAIPSFPRRRSRLPAAWRPYRRRRSLSAAELRVMLWAGLLLGLLFWQALRILSEPTPAFAPVRPPAEASAAAPDPWAEARRSAAILGAQEVAPSPAVPTRRAIRTGGSSADPAFVRVVDGDTFVYAGERIRVVGIDTPETHPSRCAHEAELGARATVRLRTLLAEGPFELVPIDRDTDRYGRKLRLVMRGGRDLGAVLVAEGLARPYSGGFREGWC